MMLKLVSNLFSSMLQLARHLFARTAPTLLPVVDVDLIGCEGLTPTLKVNVSRLIMA
jgi:hypothetical protein